MHLVNIEYRVEGYKITV